MGEEQKIKGNVHSQLVEIFNEYKGEKGAVISILQKAQDKLGYLSQEVISEIAKFSRMSETEVFGVASFYAQFRFTRCGDHVIRVCLGTACHVRGGERILDEVKRELGIEPGGTTENYKFSLERIACFGCCALAPVMVVDKNVHTKMNLSKVRDVMKRYQGGKGE
ncbi:MAG: NADH-quinone oxidoreductase subunit NuoE [Nitrospirota bacterium]